MKQTRSSPQAPKEDERSFKSLLPSMNLGDGGEDFLVPSIEPVTVLPYARM